MGDRALNARSAAVQLAALCWPIEHSDGRPLSPVPDLGPHVYADQLQVLLQDAIQDGVDLRELRAVMSGLAEQLSIRLD
jgi:hypothetical protein